MLINPKAVSHIVGPLSLSAAKDCSSVVVNVKDEIATNVECRNNLRQVQNSVAVSTAPQWHTRSACLEHTWNHTLNLAYWWCSSLTAPVCVHHSGAAIPPLVLQHCQHQTGPQMSQISCRWATCAERGDSWPRTPWQVRCIGPKMA
mmetsp:Transcript_86268/g.158074  ORF Transcript_86268/g.158074 Transcript_86268/m.158074 type:complete len:146 (-) Transcript_86268:10-447(-)